MGLLREHAGKASRDERLALYQSLRGRVDRFAASAEGEGERVKARAYRDALDVAIEAFERESDDVALVPPVVSKRDWKPSQDELDRARYAAEKAPQPQRSGRPLSPVVLSAVMGCLLVSAMVLAYQLLVPAPDQVWTEQYANGRSSVPRNVALLRSIVVAIEDHRRSAGAYPTADSWVVFSTVADNVPTLKAVLSQVGSPSGQLLFRGNGSDYKLILYHSGDCFAARVSNPDMVDPTRSAGQVDCYAYGFWTSGAAAW